MIFQSKPIYDILIYSGVEIDDNKLIDDLKKNYYCINESNDLNDYKTLYNQHKQRVKLNFHYAQFITALSDHLEELLSLSIPDETRSKVLHKLKVLNEEEESRLNTLFFFTRSSARSHYEVGKNLEEQIERESQCLAQLQRLFNGCKKHLAFDSVIQVDRALLQKVSQLEGEEYARFMELFFANTKSCRFRRCELKPQLIDSLNPKNRSLLFQKLMEREDWHLQLLDFYRFNGYNAPKIRRNHIALIKEIPEETYRDAFSKTIPSILVLYQEVFKETYDSMIFQPYQKLFARALCERALQLFLKAEATAELTELIKAIESKNLLPDYLGIEGNILASIFSNPLILTAEEVVRLKGVLPERLYCVSELTLG